MMTNLMMLNVLKIKCNAIPTTNGESQSALTFTHNSYICHSRDSDELPWVPRIRYNLLPVSEHETPAFVLRVDTL
jgi:hypothetical protein